MKKPWDMNRRMRLVVVLACVLAVALFFALKAIMSDGSEQEFVPTKPARGDIVRTVSTVGTVKPQNRLEIKPPINGRIEEILVDEGQAVKSGEVLALMSSTDRATLIDAARLKGDAEHKYWLNAYKETPLIAPIDGTVIVRSVEPGQTVGTSDAVLVLSDRLIVEADVDETDIGGIKVGQRAEISLDAYPEIKIGAVVDHKDYESQVVNNVTIYKVDILPDETPDVFRSGMSANLSIAVEESKDALVVPSGAVQHEGDRAFVMASGPSDSSMKRVEVETGIEDEGQVEIVSGLSEADTVYVQKRSFSVPKRKNGSTPFMPSFQKKDEKGGK
jgi:macrolide-specific efflux system membrane fusion protein